MHTAGTTENPAEHAYTAAEKMEAIETLPDTMAAIEHEVGEVVVGQAQAIRWMIVSAFCQRHAMVVGPPGLAKTLLVKAVAGAMDLRFARVQCTPDMMPADILGAEILDVDQQTAKRTMRYAPGPVFTNILLADEINRTPPRTQAALLEAMAERQVSVAGKPRPLPAPFVVMATQNPVEQEGTYPLPEAQLDRFFVAIQMGYPSATDERRIAVQGDEVRRRADAIRPVLGAKELLVIADAIGEIPVADSVADFAVAIVRATRPEEPGAAAEAKRLLRWGAGPRASQALLAAARCVAVIEGKPTPSLEHVRHAAGPVLRHRIVRNHAAAAEGIGADAIVMAAVDGVQRRR